MLLYNGGKEMKLKIKNVVAKFNDISTQEIQTVLNEIIYTG